jgi:hypothetical protein
MKTSIMQKAITKKDMDVNEQERLSNFTLRHTLKIRNNQDFSDVKYTFFINC